MLEQDFFTLKGQYDTILMLMNGIGIVGTLERLPEFFMQLDKILAPGGQVLCDSSDISYVFEDENGIIEYPDTDGYYGEVNYQMQYKDTIGKPFNWLYIDASTLKRIAEENDIECGFVLSGVGCLSQARIRCADGKSVFTIDDPCEIVSLTGTVGRERCHLHISLAKADLSVTGGHLMDGCIVNTTCELIIGIAEGYCIGSRFDPTTGYDEIVFNFHGGEG